jgi:hypothetical protein
MNKIMTDTIKKAVNKLNQGGYTLVVVNGEREYTSKLSGVSPLLDIIKNAPEVLSGACVADKIVGKAAAVLFVYSGVKEVYAKTVSSYAILVLKKAGINLVYEKKVPFIKNRAGTDICPMEKLVLDIEDPKAGAAALLKAGSPRA